MVYHQRPDLHLRQEITRLWSAVRKLGNASMLASASIGRGGIRVYDGGIITIENGGVNVIGWIDVNGEIRIAGTLRGNGTIDWDGPASFSGNTTIGGTLNVEGPVTLGAILTLAATGKITGAGLTIEDGKLYFSTGGSVESYASGIKIDSGGTPDVVVSTGGVSITGTSSYLTVSAGHFLGGHGTTTNPTNANIDATTNQIRRVTSASRFKVDQQLLDLPDELLEVRVKDWLDRGAVERGEDRPRVPGVIAEEVAAAGGGAFVEYDGAGEIVGVAYDRLAIARSQILADKLDAALARIDELEARLA